MPLLRPQSFESLDRVAQAIAAQATLDGQRIVLDPDVGVIAFGKNTREAQMALEMYQHDIFVITGASAHGRYRSAPSAAIALAEFEYGGYAAK